MRQFSTEVRDNKMAQAVPLDHAAEALAQRHLALADRLAWRFGHRGELIEELRQVARLGLVKAAQRFEPDRGVQFNTFATPVILGELKRWFRDYTWGVHVPRGLKERRAEVLRVSDGMQEELGRPATLPELARRVRLTEEQVHEAMELGHAYRPLGLQILLDGDDGGEGPNLFRVEPAAQEAGFAQVEAAIDVQAAMSLLNGRERLVVYLCVFEGVSQAKVAEILGVSQMQVSRTKAHALARLRARALGEDGWS